MKLEDPRKHMIVFSVSLVVGNVRRAVSNTRECVYADIASIHQQLRS